MPPPPHLPPPVVWAWCHVFVGNDGAAEDAGDVDPDAAHAVDDEVMEEDVVAEEEAAEEEKQGEEQEEAGYAQSSIISPSPASYCCTVYGRLLHMRISRI